MGSIEPKKEKHLKVQAAFYAKICYVVGADVITDIMVPYSEYSYIVPHTLNRRQNCICNYWGVQMYAPRSGLNLVLNYMGILCSKSRICFLGGYLIFVYLDPESSNVFSAGVPS